MRSWARPTGTWQVLAWRMGWRARWWWRRPWPSPDIPLFLSWAAGPVELRWVPKVPAINEAGMKAQLAAAQAHQRAAAIERDRLRAFDRLADPDPDPPPWRHR